MDGVCNGSRWNGDPLRATDPRGSFENLAEWLGTSLHGCCTCDEPLGPSARMCWRLGQGATMLCKAEWSAHITNTNHIADSQIRYIQKSLASPSTRNIPCMLASVAAGQRIAWLHQFSSAHLAAEGFEDHMGGGVSLCSLGADI
eukprot:2561098-Amphidinium_carterae.1